jgi:putative endonuclease
VWFSRPSSATEFACSQAEQPTRAQSEESLCYPRPKTGPKIPTLENRQGWATPTSRCTNAVILSEAKNLSAPAIIVARQLNRHSQEHIVKTYHVYIMVSASRVLYTGVTGDLLRRVREHKERKVPGFTARYHATELVYFEAFGDVRVAIAREKQLKGWLRSRKIALIESFNPRWKDLSAELQKPTPQTRAWRDSSLRSV